MRFKKHVLLFNLYNRIITVQKLSFHPDQVSSGNFYRLRDILYFMQYCTFKIDR